MTFGRNVEHVKTNRIADFFLSDQQEAGYFELNFQNKVIFGDLQASVFNELLQKNFVQST